MSEIREKLRKEFDNPIYEQISCIDDTYVSWLETELIKSRKDHQSQQMKVLERAFEFGKRCMDVHPDDDTYDDVWKEAVLKDDNYVRIHLDVEAWEYFDNLTQTNK